MCYMWMTIHWGLYDMMIEKKHRLWTQRTSQRDQVKV